MFSVFVTAALFAEPAVLVAGLGSPKFATREAAHTRLSALGGRALPAVSAGRTSPDPETSERCREMVPRLREAVRILFVAGRGHPGGPAWERFRRIAGQSADAKELFKAMVADPGRAAELDDALEEPDRAVGLYEARLAWVAEQQEQAASESPSRRAAMLKRVPPGEAGAVLFLGACARNGAAQPLTASNTTYHPGFDELVRGPLRVPARALLNEFIRARKDVPSRVYAIGAGLLSGVPDIVGPARLILIDPNSDPRLLGVALLAVGHHGGPGDLPLLAKLRRDERVVRDSVQVRDATAAMSLMLAGRDFADFGLPERKLEYWFLAEPKAASRSVGNFPSPEARDAALAAAWKFLDAR